MHCLSRKASFALFIHGFNRQSIFLVFPDSEAVAAHDIFLSAQTLISSFIILVITSFFRYNIKPQLQTGNKLLTEEQTLYDKIGEIM